MGKQAKDIAQEYNLKQVILCAWDGERTHIVTYGKTLEDCDQAAQGGNKIKKFLGWSEELCEAEPSRVKKLKKEIEQLKKQQYQIGVDYANGADKTVKCIIDRNGKACVYKESEFPIYIRLRDNEIDHTAEELAGIVIDYDVNNKIVGVEFLEEARERLEYIIADLIRADKV
jgi:uncharacterized protein YuzE